LEQQPTYRTSPCDAIFYPCCVSELNPQSDIEGEKMVWRYILAVPSLLGTLLCAVGVILAASKLLFGTGMEGGWVPQFVFTGLFGLLAVANGLVFIWLLSAAQYNAGRVHFIVGSVVSAVLFVLALAAWVYTLYCRFS